MNCWNVIICRFLRINTTLKTVTRLVVSCLDRFLSIQRGIRQKIERKGHSYTFKVLNISLQYLAGEIAFQTGPFLIEDIESNSKSI